MTLKNMLMPLTYLSSNSAPEHRSIIYRGRSVLVLMVLAALTARAADNLAEAWKQDWNARMTNVLGPLDFAREGLIPHSLARIYPQLENAFRPFTDEKLSSTINKEHQEWLQRIFKGPFCHTLTNVSPSKYYLNAGRAEPSLLLYRCDYERNAIVLVESFEAFILTIKPPNFVSTQTIERNLVGRVLFEWINLNKRRPIPPDPPWVPGSKDVRLGHVDDPNPYTVPYVSVDEILDSFGVPAEPKVGDIFRTTRPYTHLTTLRFWQNNVTGFVGKDGLCFILHKVDRPGDPRMDFPFDYNWLNKGLFQVDGRTLVDPPRNRSVNESPDFDGRRLR